MGSYFCRNKLLFDRQRYELVSKCWLEAPKSLFTKTKILKGLFNFFNLY